MAMTNTADLNERVCRKMGIESKREWAIGMAERELIHRTFQSKEFAEAWLKAEKKMGISLDYEVWESITYPDLLTPEWAGKLLEMLAARGIPLTVKYQTVYAEPWSCGEAHGPLLWRAHKTLAEAVCRAIDSMLEVNP